MAPEIAVRGHAIEVRVNSEDPEDGYAPQTGVIEAMKMLHSLPVRAPQSVVEVLVEVGDQVTSGQTLVTFEKHDAH